MLFNSWVFWLFVPVVIAGYAALYALGKRRTWGRQAQNAWLLIASYVFYGYWDWRFLSLIALATGVNYGCGLALSDPARSERDRRLLLTISLVVTLGMLAVFKYTGFFVRSFMELASALGMDVRRATIELVLPIGISFYTFQTLSYTIDVYRRKLNATRNLLDFATFVCVVSSAGRRSNRPRR